MSDSAFRTAIKNILTGVPGTGVVHDYERLAATDAKFLELFKDQTSGKILGWEITRTALKIEKPTLKFRFTHVYALRGYYGLKDSDASEKFINTLVDAIVVELISIKITGTDGILKPQVPKIEPRVFGGTLCHYIEIGLDVSEIVEKTSTETLTDLLKVGLEYYLRPGDENADSSDLVEF